MTPEPQHAGKPDAYLWMVGRFGKSMLQLKRVRDTPQTAFTPCTPAGPER